MSVRPTFFNDNDPGAAAWLRELIQEGHLPKGTVDERPIQEVQATDLQGFGQCHFFAGIGGWPYALRLAGWPESRPVWTGSCPCQPFSDAGKGAGIEDKRHLWPVFFRLVRECRPSTIFGEQVASLAGRHWLARVRGELEEAGYAVGCANLCAAGVGANHKRQRLFWCADADRGERPRIERPVGAGENAGFRAAAEALEKQPRRYAQLVAMGLTERVSSYADALRLLDGIPGRVGRLRGYGNAIVPQVAAKFVRAFLEAEAITSATEKH